MRIYKYLILTLLICTAVRGEDAESWREKGIAALKDSQSNPHAIVEAARSFVKAAALYNDAGNEDKTVEMNSFLYWCKKKMSMEDIDAFTKGGEAAVSLKLAAVENLAPKIDEAQKWFDRAAQFANANPNEHLLIAVRFYEVADRFQGSKPSLAAQDRSLKEQLLDKSTGAKTAVRPTGDPVPPVPNDLAKQAIPPADDLKKAEKLIKTLFKDDYAKIDAASRLSLCAKLLQQADENKGDAASEYVLLHEARDCAILAGDAALAVQTQTRLRAAFSQDFTASMADLRRVEALAKPAESGTALASIYAQSADEALAAENYDQAVRFNSRAEDLLPVLKDAGLKARLKTEIPRVQMLKRESVAADAAHKTLAAKPDDPDASLVAGKFALLLGQFENSFNHLAKSNDAVLADVAKRELSAPQDAAAQSALADAWFERAEKEPAPFFKACMQERAALWYSTVLPELTGLAKLKVEGQLKALPQNKLAEPPVAVRIPEKSATKNATFNPVGSWGEKGDKHPWILNADSSISGGDEAGGKWELQNGKIILHYAKWHGTGTWVPVDDNTVSTGKKLFIRVGSLPEKETPAKASQVPGFNPVGSWGENRPWVLNADSSISGGDGAGGKWELQGGKVILHFAKWHGTVTWVPLDDNTLQEGKGKPFKRAGSVNLKEIPSPKAADAFTRLPTLSLDLGGGVKMELISIPAGTFQMGSPENEIDRNKNELSHRVTLSRPFYMGKYPVTQAQYEAVVGSNPSKYTGASNPVERVSWNEAAEFCDKLGDRAKTKLPAGMKVALPTEAQWEFACRAGTQTRFYSGNDDSSLDSVAWYLPNSDNKPHPVGEKKPNAVGLYDMHGNVTQWCRDWFAAYPGSAVTDPLGPPTGTQHVLRGSSFVHEANHCRSAKRYAAVPESRNYRGDNYGFRVVICAE